MLSLLAAECLLSLFSKPERAASIAGDLLEEARDRSSLWFWSQVLRTTARLFGRNLASAPVRVSILVLVGCLLELASAEAYNVVYGELLNSAAAAAKANVSINPLHMFLGDASLLVWHVTHPFLIGLIVATFARRREITVCAAVAGVSGVFYFGAEQYWLWTNRSDLFWPERLVRGSAASVESALFLATAFMFAGMVVAGRRKMTERTE